MSSTEEGIFVHRLLEKQVEKTPNCAALIDAQGVWSYSKLNQQANQLARVLRNRGVESGQRVGLLMENSATRICALVAILKAGAVYVPLAADDPTRRLRHVLDDSDTSFVLGDSRLIPSECGRSRTILDYAGLRAESEEVDTRNLGVKLPHNSLAAIFHTSGSTGKPKGVMRSHRSIALPFHPTISQWTLEPHDRVILHAPVSFVVSLDEVLHALGSGITGVVADSSQRADPAYLVGLVVRQQVSFIYLTASSLRQFLQQPGIEQCHSLKYVLCYGEPLASEMTKMFFKKLSARLIVGYGSTEAPGCAFWEPRPGNGTQQCLVGPPSPYTRIHLLDENHSRVQTGETGEIYLEGPRLANGYWRQPKLTEERFLMHAFPGEAPRRLFKSGDLGRLRADGMIEFQGRKDAQVKIRGVRIDLTEVESRICTCPEVAEAAVAIRETETGEQVLAAYLVKAGSDTIHVSALCAMLHEWLPVSTVPRHFIEIERLPTNSHGKLDRQSLPPLSSASTRILTADTSYQPPSNETEKLLCQLVQRIVGCKKPGIDTSVFDLGCDSVHVAQLFSEIDATLGRRLRPGMILRAPTVRKLARMLEEMPASHERSLIPIQPLGNARPLFLIHAHQGTVLLYRDLAQHLGPDQPLHGFEARGDDAPGGLPRSLEATAAGYVEEMISFQREGPYLLGGFCLGGLLAFEMARQLTMHGRHVALLALIETRMAVDGESANGHDLVVRAINSWRRTHNQITNLFLLERGTRWSYVQRQVRKVTSRRSKAFSGIEQKNVQRTADMVSRYSPQTYEGRVTLFRGQEQPHRTDPTPDSGWGTLARGGVEIHEIPGYSQNILFSPRARILAQELRACLDRALQED